jgi:hypothetical protein
MYANIDNPPQPITGATAPGIDTDSHFMRLACISRVLALAAQAHERAAYCSDRYERYTLGSSPYVSRSRWQDDAAKWAYITQRLERYYFCKVCELNSMAYRQIKGRAEFAE